MAGCGGDDTTGTVPEAGQPDTTTQDVAAEGSSSDVTTTETSVGEDAGDGGADAMGTEEGGDAGDAADVAVDAPALVDFPHAVSVAYCAHLGECCNVPANQWNLDGMNGCVPIIESQAHGFRYIAIYQSALDSGAITYDPAAAANCLQEVSRLPCGVVQADMLLQVQNDCFAAMKGTLGADAGPCINSGECLPGQYCLLGDASTGTCAPLQGQGQPCTDTVRSSDCTYLGNGDPALYCAQGDAGATCQPAQPLDAGCKYNAQCESQTCKAPYCASSLVFANPGGAGCAYFTISDAGADTGTD
jgi:hypothetical protein